jgi:DNA-binding transcriptional ArsR family regulator
MSARSERRRPVSKAALFAALGDETRLRLIDRLADGKGMPISALCQGAEFTRQAMTKHLRVLERAGFVRAKRVGRETRFAYQPSALDEAQKALDEIGRRWEQALDRLQALVEADNK